MSERRYLETRNFSYELSKIKVELIRIEFYKVKVRGKKVN